MALGYSHLHPAKRGSPTPYSAVHKHTWENVCRIAHRDGMMEKSISVIIIGIIRERTILDPGWCPSGVLKANAISRAIKRELDLFFWDS